MKKLFLLGLLMIMSVCYIFGQGEALDAKKGFYIYLKGSKTAITENEYLNYAKVMEYNVYKKYINDEFEWHDQFQTLKKNFDNAIANANFDATYTVVTNVDFGDYDFTKEGFPVSIGEGTFFPLGDVDPYWSSSSGSIFRKAVALKLDGFEKYNFFAMPKDQAKTFLQGRKKSSGKVNRSITLQIKYKIASYDSAEYKSFADLALQNNYLPIVGLIEDIEIFDASNSKDVKKIGSLIKN
ncbi:MAG: DUF4852 domain-containing protein [Spirochaetaceae bacterium]|nr:DUF4852 domain-containing protein [Spirochaetaceae bacterium]